MKATKLELSRVEKNSLHFEMSESELQQAITAAKSLSKVPQYSERIRRQAVSWITRVGLVSYQAAKRLGIHPSTLSGWQKEFADAQTPREIPEVRRLQVSSSKNTSKECPSIQAENSHNTPDGCITIVLGRTTMTAKIADINADFLKLIAEA